jgi:hypothetical protein
MPAGNHFMFDHVRPRWRKRLTAGAAEALSVRRGVDDMP